MTTTSPGPDITPAADLQAAFDRHTEATADGHLVWTGPRTFSWGGASWRPSHAAYVLRTGRAPEGYVRADCDHTGCILPAHVTDQADRARIRAQLRALRGLPDPDPVCGRGHDQAVYGRLQDDGRAYCHACATTAPSQTFVDAAPARQELRQLTAQGFTAHFLAAAAGIRSAQTVVDLRSGRTQHTAQTTVAAIHAVWEQVDGTSPAAHGIPARSAGRSRTIAARNGWSPRADPSTTTALPPAQ